MSKERITKYRDFMPDMLSVNVLNDLNFFDAPASLKYHGAYNGGLYDHSQLVAEVLVDMTNKLDLIWERPESPYIVGMYHDLCKCDNYIRDPYSNEWVYNDDVIIPGHAEKSLIILQRHIDLTDEEIACIRWHMGAFETDTKMWNYYTRAIAKYPNVLYTHTADMIASHIKGV